MHKLTIALCIFFCLVISIDIRAQNFGGNPAAIHWKQVNSPASRVIFPKGLDSQASRISHIIALLDTTTSPTIGGRYRKWNVVLQTQTTIPNAYVRLAPVISELNMTPGQDNFSTGSVRWDDNLIIHENRHMQQFSNFNNGLTKVFSFFLGQEGQLLANGISIPNYFFEGDAVWQETLVSAQGRGRMPAFYNGFKSLWQANKNYSWMKLRSGSYKDLVPDHYPLGYMLVAYGYATYGNDFWRKVTDDAVRFKGLFYAFNKAIEKYSGKPYTAFRADALAFFKAQALAEDKTAQQLNYLTGTEKNNVVDYLFPAYISNDSIVVTKQSYKNASAFYILTNGREKKLRVKNTGLDEYFSYRNGKIVYASFQSDPRWANRDYSVLQLVDVHTGQQKQLTYRSRYFSPDINATGTEIIAVQANTNGTNNLTRLNAATGAVTGQVPNPGNFFFTQTKYIDAGTVISAVRDPQGKMSLVKIDLANGQSTALLPFTFNVVGYPFVKGDDIYYSAMDNNADKVFVVNMQTKMVRRVTQNNTGVYGPVLNSKNELLVAAYTAAGSRLAKINTSEKQFTVVPASELNTVKDLYTPAALHSKGANELYALTDTAQLPVTSYSKAFRLFNFHSARPVAADPEYGYSFYSDNILSSFSNILTYTYNRNERSHNVEFTAAYAGWFPVITLGVQGGFNRTFDTAVGKSFSFNSAKVNAGAYVPLSFIGGRTNKYLSFGAGYNAEQLYYTGIGKNIFTNQAFEYANAFVSFSNVSRQAKQHVAPRWAQSIEATYRHAFTFLDSRKFVGAASLYFPGLFANHSIVVQGAFQKRDSLPDIFSNTFSYARGYEGLSTRQMYKLGVNYQLPIAYPDWGVGNIIFFQRIRANAFFDYTSARARLSGVLTDIINRSTGTEVFFDTKIWNALPLSFGVRYSRLLDADLRNPGAVNRWEFIVPVNLIPD